MLRLSELDAQKKVTQLMGELRIQLTFKLKQGQNNQIIQ